MSKPPRWLLHCLMLLTASLVSTSFTVSKAIAQEMDPVALTLIRFGCAVVCFFPYVQKKYRLARPDVSSLLRYSTISFVLTGFFVLMFLSLQFTTALNTGVLFTLVPGISGIYSILLLKERLGKYRQATLFIAMVGAVWVLFHGDLQTMLAFHINKGDLIFLGGCLLLAFYTPLVKLLYHGEPMAVMTLWILITGCGWLLVPAIPKLYMTDWSTIPLWVWGGIFYLSVFCTIITFFISQWTTLYLGPTRVMAYSYLYPPLILGINWILGQDLPSAQTLPGVIMIALAMIIVQRGTDNSKEISSNSPSQQLDSTSK